MIPHIPPQRKFATNAATPFNDLVSYLEAGDAQEKGSNRILSSLFSDILDYATNPLDALSGTEKCIAIRTHAVTDITTASLEMNAVAKKNMRCTDPAYHVILSWPEHEHPAADLIFDAAGHALAALGLAEHQYVLAVHGNTDNTHCHICVNRVHPQTYKSRHIEWAVKTLHKAARQSEIKHGWTHDNGLYIIVTDAQGHQQIVENKDLVGSALSGSKLVLPAWHDPESLDSWLKTTVAKALRPALEQLSSWSELHAWLAKYAIALSDTGGGGMRLRAVSADTGEVLDVAASKGLRLMRRIELERRWGPFLPKDAPASEASTPLATDAAPVAVKTVDFSGFSSDQMQRAIDTYLAQAQAPDGSRGPMPRARRVPEAAAVVAVDHGAQTAVMPQRSDLPNTPEQKREVARAALRLRFLQYRALVRAADPAYVAGVLQLQDERRQRRRQILEFVAKSTPRGAHGLDVVTHCRNVIEIDAERQRRLEALKSWYREQKNALSATRTAPLSWRAWLHDQSMRGDPGALAALRGIVYQAGRDALGNWAPDSTDPVSSDPSTLTPTQRYQQLMERLLEQERKEVAIRSADEHAARPFEVDALFANYADMRWRVTGNGNIAYSKANGTHLFTDRGNRITFDRVQVSDDAIRLALTHAQKKFGDVLTLSGNDAVFSARMARLADDMGLTILNPELQAVITRHRTARNGQATQAAKAPLRPSPAGAPSTSVGRTEPEPDLGAHAVRATAALEVPASEEPLSVAGVLAKLRAAVLSVDPRAEFEIADPDPRKGGYYGKVVCVLDADAGFAQRTGRGVYTLHSVAVPVHPVGEVVDVRYRDGVAVAKLLGPDQDLGRG